jgi:phosphoglycolate phosphatase-like HAD superfamily hydrolase
MNLVMFDVDGTLTQTNSVDNECFIQALDEVLGIRNFDSNWSIYKNVTDQGCLEEITKTHKGRPGTKDELLRAKERHVKLLQERAESHPALFLPVPGAQDVINNIRVNPSAVAALATGAWLESVQIKLRAAGIVIDGLPIATCSEAVSRDEIMKIAEIKAKDPSGIPFHSRTYVGDAVWDVQASKRLGYSFIGIASKNGEGALKAEGARWLVPDFLPGHGFGEFLQAIWDRSR